MAPKRRKTYRTRLAVQTEWETDGEWTDDGQREAEKQAKREAGKGLYDRLLALYACCKLTAEDLCVLCDFCQKAGVGGGSFHNFAMEPDGPSGSYQRHIDDRLPRVKYGYHADIVSSAPSPTMMFQLANESINEELEADPGQVDLLVTLVVNLGPFSCRMCALGFLVVQILGPCGALRMNMYTYAYIYIYIHCH